jgi:hypothetical protein
VKGGLSGSVWGPASRTEKPTLVSLYDQVTMESTHTPVLPAGGSVAGIPRGTVGGGKSLSAES